MTISGIFGMCCFASIWSVHPSLGFIAEGESFSAEAAVPKHKARADKMIGKENSLFISPPDYSLPDLSLNGNRNNENVNNLFKKRGSTSAGF